MSNENIKDILIIIPTYNEADNVRKIANAVLAALPEAHILFVDDNSPDGTSRIIKKMREDNPHINLLSRPNKAGLGRAYIAGFKWALERPYRFIMEMDADFSHNPAELPRFIKEMENSDLTLGSRYINGIRIINWPLERLILSKAASLYVRLLTRMPFSDPTGGFKCFRREVLAAINLDKITSNGYSFQIEMTHTAWRMGFRIKEIPIIFEDRRSGCSKMHSSIVREALWMVVKLSFRRRRA